MGEEEEEEEEEKIERLSYRNILLPFSLMINVHMAFCVFFV